jgi:hypothetical protein
VVADLERRSHQRTIDPTTAPTPVATIDPTAAATPVAMISQPSAASTMHLERLGQNPADAGAAAALDPHAPAGWYVDPSGLPHTLRYWNGSEWTKHTARR